ncbi:large-conductance mechanosensitive channel protein MscL [Mogibacterium pumilum]|uniref:Large-conductance mechanosensitive channel n=1 Tax=Mogibacterium pumilum TaxID=86332 RepID=A0A223AQI5_9FIRM|nr:large-conductance mechanosensitive channel protein MscL [Mogibacterium pumilum]ASS37205.1 mechanosensitive ion channel protein MscL [Mogibacterium pumilum]
MKETKGLIAEFKEFISRGNVLDMAVGIIIGSAFTAIITSLVNDIIMPIVGVIIGGIDFSGLKVSFGSAAINYGVFIQAIINFLLIALTVFLMIKAISKANKKQDKEAAEEPATPTPEVELLTEIRDLLSKRD